MSESTTDRDILRVAHLTTVDLSLRFLLWPQLLAVVDAGGESYGISSPGPWVADLESAGVTHIPLQSSTRGVSILSDLRAAIEFWREMRRTPLTVLHTHNPKPGIYGRILGRLAGVPVVVNTLHGFYATETDRWPKRAIVYGLEAVAARFSDAELHQNIEDLELARRLRIVPRSRSRLLGNGIDLTRFDPSNLDEGARRRIRDELGASDDDVVIGTVGRLVAEKGFPELFEAAEQLGDGFVVAVVGPVDPDKPDALPPEVIDRARESGVCFLGMRQDMEDLYSAMDIFVLPSHREGFPRAAMEAAAMGLPVVATDIRGCRQVVDHGVNGLLVPVRDPGGLLSAFRSLGDDPDLRSTMSDASRRIALESFDERNVVRIVMETYRDALSAKGMSHLLPAALLGDDSSVTVRPARDADVRAVANLHVDTVSGGSLAGLGRRFMRVLYRALLRWPGTCAVVAEDEAGVVAFIVAVDDVAGFSRWFSRTRWLATAWAALPALVRPASLRRARETLRYGLRSAAGDATAEVLSLAVAPRARGAGLSTRLIEEGVGQLSARGASSVRVIVGSNHPGAIRAFTRAGFEAGGSIDVHAGESSTVLMWRPQP